MRDLKISIIYMTYRPGGFDLLLHGLKAQEYSNYELIVVDDYPNRNLTELFRREGVPIKWYGSSKTKTVNAPFGQANAFNTGLLNAEGDIVLNVNDYTWMFPTALKRWNTMFQQKPRSVICGIASVHDYVGSFQIGQFSVFDPPFNGEFDRFPHNSFWIPTEWELFYSAMPLAFLKAINGIDERADYDTTFAYYSLLSQAKYLDYLPFVDKQNFCVVINHRYWEVGDQKLWYVNRTTTPTKKWEDISWQLVSPNSIRMG